MMRGQKVTVDVDIDVDDFLDNLTNEDLLAELRSREIQGPALGCEEAEAKRALDCLRRGDVEEAALILERALFPKFKNLGMCMSQFAKAKGGLA